MMFPKGDRNTLLAMAAALVLAFVGVAWVGHAPMPVGVVRDRPAANLLPDQAYPRSTEEVVLKAGASGQVYVAHGADGGFELHRAGESVAQGVDRVAVARLLATPTSLNWRHPLIGSPAAEILRVADALPGGRGPERLYTLLQQHHGGLPVVSIQLPTDALVGPDSGLLVVGNAILQAPAKVLLAEVRDPKWWKYPGNFHMRGKAWERVGRVQYIEPDGTTGFERPVRIRVNGQMTRGFPQHALRLSFDDPLSFDLFDEEPTSGYEALILRAGGNDQIKAMLRDVFQHALCEGLPFETSGHRTCVVYINGAYWGVHHLRPRMDEKEIARRYGIKKKRITILEDEARLYHGDPAEVPWFERFARRTAAWDGTSNAWADTLEAHLDVEGFLTYMATQMVFGNMDWPNQNVRFWRYSGEPGKERPLDGRWYFIMGDSDLGYGALGSPHDDMFLRVKAMDVPVTQLFRGMMRAPRYKARFVAIARGLVHGPLATPRALEVLDRIAAHMEPEMGRHTARWRKPADPMVWKAHLDVMRTYAHQRSLAVLEQLEAFEQLNVKEYLP